MRSVSIKSSAETGRKSKLSSLDRCVIQCTSVEEAGQTCPAVTSVAAQVTALGFFHHVAWLSSVCDFQPHGPWWLLSLLPSWQQSRLREEGRLHPFFKDTDFPEVAFTASAYTSVVRIQSYGSLIKKVFILGSFSQRFDEYLLTLEEDCARIR